MCNRFGTRVCCRLVSLVLFFTSRARRRDACGNVVVSADFDFSRLSVAALRFKMVTRLNPDLSVSFFINMCYCLTCWKHGRLKVRTTAEQQELKQKERARKLAIYKSLVEKIYTKVSPASSFEGVNNLSNFISICLIYQEKKWRTWWWNLTTDRSSFGWKSWYLHILECEERNNPCHQEQNVRICHVHS